MKKATATHRAISVVFTLGLLLIAPGCGDDTGGAGGGGGGGETERPTCEELGETCHASTTELGQECHEFGEATTNTEEQCQARKDECLTECAAGGTTTSTSASSGSTAASTGGG